MVVTVPPPELPDATDIPAPTSSPSSTWATDDIGSLAGRRLYEASSSITLL
jgi:hypothetical protein